ncbi:MAG TPA: long-chain-acyl-CoA synthetase, partial [Solimonas sp.]|nr:long-chain-acyl-CoA synthetase [Solimonas sp.]
MSGAGERVRLRDILRSAVRGLVDAPTINKGLWSLLTIKPDRAASIGLVLQRCAEAHPQRTALVFEGQRWSYAEFNAWANRIAGVLRAQGVLPGGRVAILMENRPEVLGVVAATVKLGAIAGMLNHNQRGEVLAHSIKLTGPDAIVVGQECREAFDNAQAPEDAKAALLWDGAAPAPSGWIDLRRECEAQPDANPPETAAVLAREPCFFIFTSGTTGMPKASRMTHYRWLRSMAGMSQLAVRFKPEDVLYCPLPLYHNNALTVSWGTVLGAGATLALGRKFSVSKFWDEIRQHQATAFCYIGELCRYLLNRPAGPRDREHKVRLMIGNGLRPEIWEEFQQRFGIDQVNEFYGASESNLAFVNGFNLSRTAGFCPMSFAIVEFDADLDQPVRDARGHLKKVAKGGVGLLITEVSDKSPFDGYTDKKASEAKLLRDAFVAGDCWVNSGDLVRDQGYKHIQFVDRVGDTFRWKGENVA